MVMDIDKKAKVEEYINNNEQEKWYWKLAETVADLVWVEEEVKEWFLNKWLKNEKSLLEYAELSMKTEKLNFWETIKRKLLEVKLSITCPYFADFKDFLEELKLWTDTSKTDATSTSTTSSTSKETTSESIDLSTRQFCWTSVSRIKSEPFEKNSKTWVTWCSKTAYNNWYNFGLRLPSWDAYNAGKKPWVDCIETIPANRKNDQPKKSWEWIDTSAFRSLSKWNYAEIYVESKSDFGHRATAFKDDSWKWYVLDPNTRVNWRLDNTPKKLEDYSNTRKIVKAHIYESRWYVKKDNHDNIWSWYEWKNH